MAVLLALDPGKTTGLVFGEYSDNRPFKIKQVEQVTIEEYFATLGVLDQGSGQITVVCEDFTLRRGRPMSGDQTLPMYLIGALQYIAYQNRNITLVMQSPAAAKQGVTDEHLENLELLQTPKTKWDHANDALRHAVQYLKSIKHMPTLEGGFK